jgi:outer membrane biosynthesis protein TonB
MSDKNMGKHKVAPEASAPGSSIPSVAMSSNEWISVFEVRDEKKNYDEKTYRIQKDRIVIGAVESADISLEGEGISPIHSVIEVLTSPGLEGSLATLYDLASESGTFVGGRKIIAENLKSGDQIRVGSFLIKYRLESLDQYRAKNQIRESGSQRLFLNPNEDFTSLLLEDEREVEEIFDYGKKGAKAIEVVMSWKNSILSVEHFLAGKTVLIGEDQKCHFAIPPVISSVRHPLIEQRGDTAVLNLDTQMSGVIQSQGKLRTVNDVRDTSPQGAYGFEVPLGKSDFAKITVGEIDFYVCFTDAPPRLKPGRLFQKDPLLFKVFAGSFVLTVAILLTLFQMKVPQSIEAEKLSERIVTILYQPERHVARPKPPQPAPPRIQKSVPAKEVSSTPTPTPPESKPTPKRPEEQKVAQQRQAPQQTPAQRQDQGQEGQGARATGTQGTRGTRTAQPRQQAAPQQQASRPSPQAGEGRGGEGRSQVPDDGNLDILKGATARIQNLLGSSSERLGKGGKKLEGYGGFDTRGSGGLALSGTGSGGGGGADTRLGGTSDQGTGGGRVGTGRGASGTGTGMVGGQVRVDIQATDPEELVFMGAIDEAAVDAAIRRHADEFRLCYEREVNAGSPNLAGRVGTSFTIGATGRVNRTGITTSSIKNANIDACVLGVLRRIQFPQPRGGGIVEVRKSFTFRRT